MAYSDNKIKSQIFSHAELLANKVDLPFLKAELRIACNSNASISPSCQSKKKKKKKKKRSNNLISEKVKELKRKRKKKVE